MPPIPRAELRFRMATGTISMTYGSDLKIFADGNMVLQQAYDGPLTSSRIPHFPLEWQESTRINGRF